MFNESNYKNMYYAVLCDIMKHCGYTEEVEKRQEKLILKLLKSNDTDTDDTDMCAGISEWIKFLFGSNQKVKEKLKKIKKNLDDLTVENKIDKIISFISNNQSEYELSYSGKNNSALIRDNIQSQIVIRRDINYLEYFIIKENCSEYVSDKPYTGNVGEFENMSRAQLVKQFKANKFYELNSFY